MNYLGRDRPSVEIVVKNGRASFKSPWRDGNFLDDLKARVPGSARRWDGTAWTVKADYMDALKQLVAFWYNDPTIVEAEQ